MKNKLSSTEQAILISIILLVLGYASGIEAFLYFAVLVTTTFLIAWLWQKFALTAFSYNRTFSEYRAFVGETIAVTLSMTNAKFLPLPRLTVLDFVSENLSFSDVTPEVSPIPGLRSIRQHVTLSWFQRVGRTYHIECTQRGFYRFSQIYIETGDPFHLFTVRKELPISNRIIIYPQIKPITGLEFLSKELLGEHIADRRIFEDPIYMRGVRPYQPEDDLRYVHWKATARTNSLQTKIFEPTTSPTVILFVNIATFSKHWHGIDPALLERVVSVSASMCAYCIENRLAVGLLANGTLPFSDQPLRVMPGRSPQQLTNLLESLAGIKGVASGHFEDFLLHGSSRLSWGATIVVITAVITPELEVTLLRLKDAGRKLVLLSMAETLPSWLHKILIYHLPGREQEDHFHFIPIDIQPKNEDTLSNNNIINSETDKLVISEEESK